MRATAPPVKSLHRALPPAAEVPRSSWSAGAAHVDGLTLVFIGYLAYVAIEWGGLSRDFPILKTLHVSALLNWAMFGYVVSKARLHEALAAREVKLLIGLFGLTVLSMAYAEIARRAYLQVRPTFDNVVFLITTIYLMDRRSRIDKLAIVLAGASTLLVVRNLGRFSGARMGGLHGPYFMGELNDLAWGLVVMLPLIAGLIVGDRRLITRLIGLGGVWFCLLGIISSQSRGGSMALGAALLYGWWFVSKRRALGAIGVVVVALGVGVIAPEGYFSRMQSVTAYEEDNSAQGRLEAWGAAIRMASDYPLGVGAGNFNSAYGRHYLDVNNSRINYAAARWISAHSIFFKTMGEFGFPGFLLLLCVLLTSMAGNARMSRILRSAPENAPLDSRWPQFVTMSLIGYCVAGAFLSGIEYPHLYLLTGLAVGLRRIVNLEFQTAGVPVASSAAAPEASRRIGARVGERLAAFPGRQ
jgi:putative inorganic carbon (HCO3(-)) transporter